ncbi:MAG: hypothetical protein Q4F67_15610, partial [Propionibacteriaceae bacterium]|nr:hypothetical protein [Propionibacteriaceae bacterium]
MASCQPHLEHRPTGFYWRRRVPAGEASRFTVDFFCFPLRTQFLREAADLARRLTAISEICFAAECDVSPEVMTQILVGYARLEIETADRLRALSAPRSRAAAEAALAMEDASRNALREAILLCDRQIAMPAIESTIQRLGLTIAPGDEDMPVLADRMVRVMIEVSEEKSRRARGYFREEQPYLELALKETSAAFSAPPAEVLPDPALSASGLAIERDDIAPIVHGQDSLSLHSQNKTVAARA